MLREKIETRLNELQKCLENNDHINDPLYTKNLIDSISKFWSVLSEEDKDYIQAAQHAIDKQKEWK